MISTLFDILFFFPFISFIFFLFLKKKSTRFISFFSISLSTIYILLLTSLNGPTFYKDATELITWFRMGEQRWTISFYITSRESIMMHIVYLISWVVLIFSSQYMKKEEGYYRYVAFIHLFIFSMIGITISGNLFFTFFCWELVGVCSYFLISFWYEKKENIESAQKAFFINKIGDICFLFGIIILFTQNHSLDLIVLKYTHSNTIWATLGALGVVIGCLVKSAQFPFYNWLPSAMKGPTPVSALMHSATMVAAGVFLLIKFSCILTPILFSVITYIGISTLILSFISIFWEWDIKKILAYSTISQLAYMMIAIGLKSLDASFFYLVTHAIAKAGLFLCIGFLTHQFEKFPSDIRELGGLKNKIPLLFYIYLIVSLSSIGFPFLSGFLSKEALLNSIWDISANEHWMKNIFYLLLGSSLLTTLYTTRHFLFIFLGKEKKETKIIFLSTSSKIKLYTSIFILSILSIGFIFSVNPFSYSSSWMPGIKLIPHVSFIYSISLVLIGVGIIACYLLYSKQLKSIQKKENWMHRFIQRNMGMDFLYEKIILVYPHRLAQLTNKIEIIFNRSIDQAGKIIIIVAHVTHWIDNVIVDGLINGLGYFISRLSFRIKTKQQQSFQQYARWLLVVIVLVLVYLLWIH